MIQLKGMMRKRLVLLIFCAAMAISSHLSAKIYMSVSGYVRDADTGKPMKGVDLFIVSEDYDVCRAA